MTRLSTDNGARATHTHTHTDGRAESDQKHNSQLPHTDTAPHAALVCPHTPAHILTEL